MLKPIRRRPEWRLDNLHIYMRRTSDEATHGPRSVTVLLCTKFIDTAWNRADWSANLLRSARYSRL